LEAGTCIVSEGSVTGVARLRALAANDRRGCAEYDDV
jgi:hypothetical protein